MITAHLHAVGLGFESLVAHLLHPLANTTKTCRTTLGDSRLGWLNGFDKKEYAARLRPGRDSSYPFLEEPDKPTNKAPKNEKKSLSW